MTRQLQPRTSNHPWLTSECSQVAIKILVNHRKHNNTQENNADIYLNRNHNTTTIQRPLHIHYNSLTIYILQHCQCTYITTVALHMDDNIVTTHA